LSSASISEARFVPGTILASRYRIVGLLGKGGMGEVYRADDLKLSQTVALKFLPTALATDGAMLARFHGEVRVARQITHPNVCRVHDIGEVATDFGSLHYLSMEYIDGEDLATLLRRIGRLPVDKGVEIARQICAGLAAAHDSGVLHRDLKPANVMIDGRGKARITDFGLAVVAEGLRGDEVLAGTPAYMAPEQLTGKEVTVKSDIYALGLVLYELFTGKRVYEAGTLDELIKLQERSTLPTPSSYIKDIEPLVERVIMRCLERDPERRPVSALQIAAALPGGDPLQAALAAGETPSPEMVAAARSSEDALRPAVAVTCLAAVFLVLSFLLLLSGKVMMHRNVPLEKSPEILAERAREIVKKLGYTDAPTDTDYRFSVDLGYLEHAVESDSSPDGWRRLASGQPVVIYFWYRQSPRYLNKLILLGRDVPDPPLDVSGLTHVELDPRGRLMEFYRVPPQLDAQSGSASPPDWSPLFTAAELDTANFKAAESRWVPPVAYDARAAWEGALPDYPQIPLRLETAAYRGQPVYFQLIYPWTKPLRQEEAGFSAQTWAAIISLGVLMGAILIGALLLARQNLRLGRGDRKGSFKLAFFVFSITLCGTFFGADHVPSPGTELAILYESVRNGLFLSALIWLGYIALEPYVRRYWPRLMISWSRLLAGEFRDPMIGRDLLIGGLLGLTHTVGIYVGWLLSQWFGGVHPPNAGLNYDTLRGLRVMVMSFLAHDLVVSIFAGLAYLFCLLLLYIILRRQWLAAGAMWLIGFSINSMFFTDSWLERLGTMIIVTSLVFTVARFGLLAAVAWQVFFFLSFAYPLTTDFSAWYSGSALFALVVIAGLSVYGFHTSLAGQSVFQGRLLEE
jgi:serine/threonine-protein kinase